MMRCRCIDSIGGILVKYIHKTVFMKMQGNRRL